MGLFKGCAALVAVLASSIGLLSVKHELLLPLQVRIVTTMDGVLDSLQDTDVDWLYIFGGAFRPAQPAHDVPMTVERGTIPADLSGVFLRVGPNMPTWPPTKRTHVFDGDGMVHSIRIKGDQGQATYHCQYVDTPKLAFERALQKPWFLRIGEIHGLVGVAKAVLFDKVKKLLGPESSPANTAVGMTPGGRVWALHEAGPPFRLRVERSGAVSSVGFDTLDGTLSAEMSAHPKYDYRTGETFFHGKGSLHSSFHVGRIADGKVQELAALSGFEFDGFHHDMFLTRDYVVVIDDALRFTPKNLPKGRSLISFDDNYTMSFGIFPRDKPLRSENAIWVPTASFSIVHTAFAYNEGTKIVLWAPVSRYAAEEDDGVVGGLGFGHMRRVVIDVESKTVTMEKITEAGPEASSAEDPAYGEGEYRTEFGRARDDHIGQTTRFGYSGKQGSNMGFNFTGILKWDFQEKKLAGVIDFPADIVGGESIFLPAGDGKGEDDRGYVATLAWNITKQSSSLFLFDAASFANEPVAVLSAPQRVPLGFHAWWLDEKDIEKQLGLF